MSTNNTLTNCRFCSVVSKANREDPIGSAGVYDRWLIVETLPPWPITMWMEPDPMPPVLAALNLIEEDQINFRPLAIAPDREYSRPDHTRVLYYSK
jgi:hypothetical protein